MWSEAITSMKRKDDITIQQEAIRQNTGTIQKKDI
mgnify:CR=1 FL=1